MENDVVTFMEQHGFLDDKVISAEFKIYTPDQLANLREILNQAIGEMRPSGPSSPFTFLASTGFRGDRCCRNPRCRLQALDKVSRFAALYSDKLYFPLAIGNGDKDDKDILEGGIRVAAQLRPLIDANVVIPIRTVPRLCKKCGRQFSPVFDQAVANVKHLADKYVGDFSVTASVHNFGGEEIFEMEIAGPEEIIGLPRMHVLRPAVPAWAKHLAKNERMVLTRTHIEDSGVIKGILSKSANDFLLQSVARNTLGTTYLTDRAGEAEFFAVSSTDRDLLLKRSEALSRIAHELPTFDELSISELLMLRHNEQHAFQNYRNAVTSAIVEAQSDDLDPKLFGDIYDDLIRPRVDVLEVKDIEEKKRHRLNLIGRACAGTFGALFGALVSGVHPVVGAAIAAGILCINKSAGDDLIGSFKSSPTVRSDDFYFLLTLRRASRHSDL